jgi:hypothetical protein
MTSGKWGEDDPEKSVGSEMVLGRKTDRRTM